MERHPLGFCHQQKPLQLLGIEIERVVAEELLLSVAVVVVVVVELVELAVFPVPLPEWYGCLVYKWDKTYSSPPKLKDKPYESDGYILTSSLCPLACYPCK